MDISKNKVETRWTSQRIKKFLIDKSLIIVLLFMIIGIIIIEPAFLASMTQMADYSNRFWPNLPELSLIIPILTALLAVACIGCMLIIKGIIICTAVALDMRKHA